MTRAAARITRWTALRRVLQALLVVVAILFIVRFARSHQADLGRVEWRLRPGALALASLVWAGAFGGLVILWSHSLRWWDARMRGAAALRAFFLANLARYVPGAIWQFAGLAAMSAAQGVSPVAATAAVLWQQAALLGTGAALAVALSPVALAPAFERMGIAVPGLGVRLAGALAVVGLVVLLLPRLLVPVRRLVERRVRDVKAVPHVSTSQVASYLALTTVGWIGYGVAFAVFCRAVLGGEAPPPVEAGAVYVGAYVLGILFVLVPGGLGIRESALVTGLTPFVGVDRALLLAIGSRLWLTALEILGALAFLAVGAGRTAALTAPAEDR